MPSPLMDLGSPSPVTQFEDRDMNGVSAEDGNGDFDCSPLFAPFRINTVTLANRFVLPGMQRRWCAQGSPLPRLDAYYQRRVRGGVSLIITESLAVDHPSATQSPDFARLNRQTQADWTRCTETVRRAGGRIFFQLWHEGAVRQEGGSGPDAHHPTLSPSGLVDRSTANGRAATRQELADIKAGFVRSAELAQQAGADGVEIHACHGYLLDQFLWAATNRREDEYGGATIHSRVRFPAEVVAAVRQVCGREFPISFRFSQWKEIDYSARIVETPDELKTMLQLLTEAGVDVFHVSTRRFWKPEWPGSDLTLAGWSKTVSGAAVITVGSVGLSTDVMETFLGREADSITREALKKLLRGLERSEFDLVSVGRSLIGDPDWVNKIRERRYDEIRNFSHHDLRNPETKL
jgi:2,4-dienoyl-CoA reductase-like NADH-dependent reductase (Old Yellow Enzyme family)